MLESIHAHLRPATYLEIGVADGRSLACALPETHAVGIDPKPLRLAQPIRCWVKHFALTSDVFFEQHDLTEEFGGRRLDLAFIDGMHLFEYALRDFMNVERYCEDDSVVLVHDCMPIDAVVSSRERQTTRWTGDVWKLVVCLREYRPDLAVSVVDAAPSGLGVVTGLDSSSTVLEERLEEILERFIELDFAWIDQPGTRSTWSDRTGRSSATSFRRRGKPRRPRADESFSRRWWSRRPAAAHP